MFILNLVSACVQHACSMFSGQMREFEVLVLKLWATM